MAIGITPSDTRANRIRWKMDQADALEIEIGEMRAMIAVLESQIALERSALAPPIV
jgi:hypothetical protein